MKKTIQIDERLHEELKNKPGKNFTERISKLLTENKSKRKIKSDPKKRYKVRPDGFLDIPELQPHEFKKVKKTNKFPVKDFNPKGHGGKSCEHRNNKIVNITERDDGIKEYYYECLECSAKWKQRGHKPKDTDDIDEKKLKQIWQANVTGQGGPEYPGESE